MMLAAAYFDESTDESAEGHCYTVAGYVGAQDDAAILEMKWKDLLVKYGIAYFKASEVEYCAGELQKFRQHPDRKGPMSPADKAFRDQVKTDFVNLLCDDRYLVGISATILLKDWELFALDEPKKAARLPTVYNLAYQLMLGEAGSMASEHNSVASYRNQLQLRPILDSHEEHEPRFMQAYPVFCEKNPNDSRYLLPPFYESDQDYLCLQAADLLAYESRKLVSGFTYSSDPDNYTMRVAMRRLLAKNRVTYRIGYDNLQGLVDAQSDRDIDISTIVPMRSNRPTRQRKR